jgi:hypothetical protein
MAAEKHKQKNGVRENPITRSNLRTRCKARGLTVTALAARIGSPRNMVYLAVETPTRYSGTYQRILSALL